MGQDTPKQVQWQKVNHDLFGMVEVVQLLTDSGDSTELMRLKLMMNCAKNYQDWQKDINYLLNSDAKEMFYLPQKYSFTTESLCGTAGTLELEFDYYKHVLKSEIVSRHHSKVLFEQTELWYMLYNLLEAAFYMEPKGKKIGDVHPSNIVINQKGKAKIVPMGLIPFSLTNYQKMMESKTTDCFLAPEQIDEKLIEKGVYPRVDPCKAEVFSIGVTILMAGTLCDCYYLYNRGKLEFCKEKKNHLMEDISIHYSKYFYNILSFMLQENPTQRPSSSTLLKELNRYKGEILSLKKFQYKVSQHSQSTIYDPFAQQSSFGDFLTPRKVKEMIDEEKRTISALNSHSELG